MTSGETVAAPQITLRQILVGQHRGGWRRHRRLFDDPFRLRRRRGHVAHTPNRVHDRLVVGAQLGAQSPHVNVDRTDAAVAVIAPHLVHEASPRERPPRVLHQEAQQFEFRQRQAEVPPVERSGEAARVKDQFTEPQGAVHRAAPTGDGQSQARLQFVRGGCRRHHVVEMPVDIDRHEVRRRHDGHHRDRRVAGRQSSAEAAGRREVGACIDDRDVGGAVLPVAVVV